MDPNQLLPMKNRYFPKGLKQKQAKPSLQNKRRTNFTLNGNQIR